MKTFSAPGKAFLAGGYLVLDGFPAYVVALSARMYAKVEAKPSETLTIQVESPQFNGRWAYELSEWGRPTQINADAGRNPFVEATVAAVAAYCWPCQPQTVRITILSDDAYHSQVYAHKRSPGDRFSYHSKPISQVPKSGLGSSAALTVVTTAALLSTLSADASDSTNLSKVHNLAQIAHCTAQKKIGSGFDVASAVYGSLVYRRFPADTFSELFETTSSADAYALNIKRIVNSPWQVTLQPSALPESLALVMGDVQGGSETPKLVAIVNEWKKQHPERAQEVYAALNAANCQLMGHLSGESTAPLEQLVSDLAEIRTWLHILTVESGAPIEPESQARLLDACTKLEGVLGGVVPGAGGYDAVCLLVTKKNANALKLMTPAQAAAILGSSVTFLGLEEEAQGLRVEKDFSE